MNRIRMIVMLAVLASPVLAQPSENLDLTAVGKDPRWKISGRTASVADLAAIEDSELPGIHGPMSRYADRPMDFADATLVHLAGRERLTTIFTVDHADFETYRIEGRRRFRILPSSRP